jgi:glycosyltransferase involved in cell wall biosynthesis
MNQDSKRIRVLYSFPNKLGADRICYSAWQQVNGLHAAGAELLVCPGSICRPLPAGVTLRPTLSRGKFRIPYKALGGNRAYALHDYIVARRVEKLAGQIDIIHTWPRGARRTIEAANRLGIPTVLERSNAHTRYGFEVVQKECDRLGVHLPPSNESAYNEETLRIEEEEFRLAYRLLCPSEFVVKTFLDKGFAPEKLARHIYGFDDKAYFPAPDYQPSKMGLRMLFVGLCAVRKGVHYALEAWLKSSAHRTGTFTIAGEFLPDYAEKLAPMLAHPSVRVLGHRNDVPELVRNSDILTLPSVEEGFGLVCTEAMGSGCVPVVSDACTDVCQHMQNSLVHRVGDVEALAQHITLLNEDRTLLQKLRLAGLQERNNLTWDAAGVKLLEAYRETIAMYSGTKVTVAAPEKRALGHQQVNAVR